MKKATIVELRSNLSKLLAEVEQGEEVLVLRRNVPVARLVALPQFKKNKTVLGCGKGSGRVLGDLTEPFVEESSWEMLSE